MPATPFFVPGAVVAACFFIGGQERRHRNPPSNTAATEERDRPRPVAKLGDWKRH
jgi:hypothetical protein